MSAAAGRGARRLAEYVAVLAASAALAATVAAGGCADIGAPLSGEDGSVVYLDGSIFTPPEGGSDDAAPLVCSQVRAVSAPGGTCRGDWLCAGVGIFSFACAPADGGGSSCECVSAGRATMVEAAGCDVDAGDFTAMASRLCGWSFAADNADAGIQ
jgi:hypothetical protein